MHLNVLRSFLLCVCVFFPADASAGSLSKLLVVVDPGHGGEDPGAHGIFAEQEVFEAPYVYDIAMRMEREAANEGGRALLTTRAEVGIRDLPPSQVFPLDRSHIFSWDKSGVRAGSDGLTSRVLFANRTKRQYPQLRPVFISVHFDRLGKNKEIEGIRIITVNFQAQRAWVVADSCKQWLRKNAAVVESGDKKITAFPIYSCCADGMISVIGFFWNSGISITRPMSGGSGIPKIGRRMLPAWWMR